MDESLRLEFRRDHRRKTLKKRRERRRASEMKERDVLFHDLDAKWLSACDRDGSEKEEEGKKKRKREGKKEKEKEKE